MNLNQTIIYGMIFPLLFCSVGSLFARKGYVYFKTKKDKKRKCLTKTEGKIVSVSAMRMNRRCAYFYTYEYEVNHDRIQAFVGSCGLSPDGMHADASQRETGYSAHRHGCSYPD